MSARCASSASRCATSARYERADVEIGPGLTIVHGANGSGKTNLLEALYFGCTGALLPHRRRARARALRRAARCASSSAAPTTTAPHELAVGFAPGRAQAHDQRRRAGRAPADVAAPARWSASSRPTASSWSRAAPALRRAHLDQFVAALWPARAATRRGYREALAQRNALIGRVRAGRVGADALAPWNATLAAAGVALAADRAAAVALHRRPRSRAHAAELGLTGDGDASPTARALARRRRRRSSRAEIAAALDADLARGHTTRGPHRDDLVLARDGRTLRRYGSQGEQRLALLALLLAERDALAAERDATAAAAARRRDERARRRRAARRLAERAAPRRPGGRHARPSASTCPGWDARRRRAGGGAVSRRAPRPLALALATLTARLEPATDAGARAGASGTAVVGDGDRRPLRARRASAAGCSRWPATRRCGPPSSS